MKFFSHIFNLLLLLLCLSSCSEKENREIDLSGDWRVELKESTVADSLLKPSRGLGPTQNIMYEPTKLNKESKTKGKIKLPGTLDEKEFGNKVTELFLGCLSRKYRFIGKAVYTRTFRTNQQKDWRLILERVLWQSKVEIDGVEIGTQTSLSTPHVYYIKNLESGKHTISITVDNSMIHRIGEKGHAYGEHMQTIWNGILGKILLTPISNIELTEVRIHAPYPANTLAVAFKTEFPVDTYCVSLRKYQEKKPVFQQCIRTKQKGDEFLITADLENLEIDGWDEFNPQLYELEISANGSLLLKRNIGFRSFRRSGNKLYINGEPLFLRGNLDNCHFPLTGYPSMEKKDWLRIFQILKNNGCNNIRFHSYCPPEAAFEAADELGLYLAPEAGLWIDGWMPGKITAIGQGNSDLDTYVKNEIFRIADAYGTHASCCMIAIGNELGNSNFELMSQWMFSLKRLSTRFFDEPDGYVNRLYSVSTARTIAESDDYFVTHYYPYVGNMRQQMHPYTDWNYEDLYSKTSIPTVAHEIGQWPVYPLWSETKKYTGVLAASNLQALKQNADNNDATQFNEEFNFASGMQNRMMYKDEIESFMRTPSCQGIHLLGMQDYSGQGEALIGFLDSFYDEKGFWSPQEVRGCFAPIVTLAEFSRYGWNNKEVFRAALLVRNMKENIKKARIRYCFRNIDGEELAEGYTAFGKIENGTLVNMGNIAQDLYHFKNKRITLATVLIDEQGNHLSDENTWSFWVFENPETLRIPQNVVVTDNVNETLDALEVGKNVILDASKLGKDEACLKGDWGSVYWSTTWFPGQEMQTLGLWLDKEHPIFQNFSCQGYGDWIWWNICKDGRIFNLKKLPSTYRPIAMPVPDFHNNQRLGSIFELACAKGKLLVSGYKLNGKSIEERIFKNSLIKYVSSDEFNPDAQVSAEWIEETFDVYDKKNLKPEAYKNALLYIEAASMLNNGDSVAWDKSKDAFYADLRLDYSVRNMVSMSRNGQNAWIAERPAQLVIKTPAGELGSLHIQFGKSNSTMVAGSIEGRNFNIETNKMQTFHIDREDCLDGELLLKIEPSKNSFVAIEKIIFIPIEHQ